MNPHSLLAVRAVTIFLILAAPLLSVSTPASSQGVAQQAPAAAIDVVVEDGLLTVDVRDVALADVLRAIGEQAGLKVSIRGDITTRVTRSFTDVPLEEGIRRLARGHSVALFHDAPQGETEAGPLTEVWVMESSPGQAVRTRVDPRERATQLRTVRALARRRDEAAGAELSRILSQAADPIVRSRAAAALGQMGSAQAATALTTALSDQAPAVRIQAVRALRRVEGERAIQALRGVLTGDRDPRVRRVAARALGALSSNEARWALEAASSDPDESVRREVTRALARWQKRNR
ncbi:MAG: HEAT repeat domain-containing protein [Candidatus Methylomirabilia bacterium]